VLKCEGGILEDRVGDFYILYIISTWALNHVCQKLNAKLN
jgi:hypothetical protein